VDGRSSGGVAGTASEYLDYDYDSDTQQQQQQQQHGDERDDDDDGSTEWLR